MQGVEVADAILYGAPELTLFEPDWVRCTRLQGCRADLVQVNGRRNTERRL